MPLVLSGAPPVVTARTDVRLSFGCVWCFGTTSTPAVLFSGTSALPRSLRQGRRVHELCARGSDGPHGARRSRAPTHNCPAVAPPTSVLCVSFHLFNAAGAPQLPGVPRAARHARERSRDDRVQPHFPLLLPLKVVRQRLPAFPTTTGPRNAPASSQLRQSRAGTKRPYLCERARFPPRPRPQGRQQLPRLPLLRGAAGPPGVLRLRSCEQPVDLPHLRLHRLRQARADCVRAQLAATPTARAAAVFVVRVACRSCFRC